jgi:tRNA threonylcarbamoyladenosine biosynthesis protein TsaB
MKILAVDTSATTGSIALLDGPRVMAEWTLQSALTHNRRLLKHVHRLLEQAGWSLAGVDGFAVTVGPGSFTGVRIGMTTVKTLAWACHKPFLGVSSLDALAAPFGFSSLRVCPMIDARKHEVYFAFYQPDGNGRLKLLGDYGVAVPEQVVERIQGRTICCGSGWLLYEERFREKLGGRLVEAPAPNHVVRASVVGELAREKFRKGLAEDPMSSTPCYIRPSEAEMKYPHLSSHLS